MVAIAAIRALLAVAVLWRTKREAACAARDVPRSANLLAQATELLPARRARHGMTTMSVKVFDHDVAPRTPIQLRIEVGDVVRVNFPAAASSPTVVVGRTLPAEQVRAGWVGTPRSFENGGITISNAPDSRSPAFRAVGHHVVHMASSQELVDMTRLHDIARDARDCAICEPGVYVPANRVVRQSPQCGLLLHPKLLKSDI